MVSSRVVIGFKPQPGPQVASSRPPSTSSSMAAPAAAARVSPPLGEFWLHAETHGQHAKGLMVRKTREDLKDTIETAMQMYGDAAVWNDQKKFFRFRNGAVLHMAYLETDSDAQNYQGWSLTRVYVEELTQYADSKSIFKLFATLRSAIPGIRCQFRATCNPGGPGHHWVKQWVIDHRPDYPLQRPRYRPYPGLHPGQAHRQPGAADQRPRLRQPAQGFGSPQNLSALGSKATGMSSRAPFSPNSSTQRHVIAPLRHSRPLDPLPLRDWGSAKPFSVGWWAVVQDDHPLPRPDRTVSSREAPSIRYRESTEPPPPIPASSMPPSRSPRLIRAARWRRRDRLRRPRPCRLCRHLRPLASAKPSPATASTSAVPTMPASRRQADGRLGSGPRTAAGRPRRQAA